MNDVIDILANGLSVARLRVNVLASNIANAETTRTPEGGPYKRRDVVQVAQPVEVAFKDALDKMTLAKPKVTAVVADDAPPKMVYNPGHPDADKNGFVAYPNINIVNTMTDMMTATRLYQANVTALETVRDMMRSASNISIRF